MSDHDEACRDTPELPSGWVPGEGCRLGAMLVGEAPGAEEWKQKRPFVGPSGQFLEAGLEAVGIHREDMYITNTVKIWPRTDAGRTRRPNRKEIEAALPYLNKEVQHQAPKCVLALGNVAHRTLTGSHLGITRSREMSWHSLAATFEHEAKVLPTFHPSYIRSWGSKNRELWFEDLIEFATRWLKDRSRA